MKLSENVKFEKREMSMDSFMEELPSVLKYRYLLVNGMSCRILAEKDAVLEKFHDWDEVVEFRCFDETGEVHGICRGVDVVLFVIDDGNIDETKDETIIMAEYSLAGDVLSGNRSETGLEHGYSNADRLMVRRYLEFDEDGQGHIVLSRCYGFTR